MLLNLTNHPSNLWTNSQFEEACNRFGSIRDMPFPAVSPDADPAMILGFAFEIAGNCYDMLNQSPELNSAVHIMGELTLCFSLVALLQKMGITCVASTSIRNAEVENGIKSSVFEFCRFREYPNLYHGHQTEV